jgi:hypothetical protein
MQPLQSKVRISLFFGKQVYNQGQQLNSSIFLPIYLGLRQTHL